MSVKAQTQAEFFQFLKKSYTFYTGGFIVFIVALAILEQLGLPKIWIGYAFLLRHRRPVRRDRHHQPDRGHRRVLRRRAAGPRVLQRHGDRRRLDERGLVHRHGRHAVPDGVFRPRVHHGMDRRLLPRGAVPRAVPAQVRAVHDPGLPRCALRRPHPALRRHPVRDPVLLHLRGGADLRRGAGDDATGRRPVRARHLPRAGRHPGVFVPRRDARGDLDAGGAVHRADRRVHDPGRLAVDQAHELPDPAGGVRQGAREGERARGGADQGSEGARGPEDLRRPRGSRECEAEGTARVVRDGEDWAREGRRRPQGRRTRRRTRSRPRSSRSTSSRRASTRRRGRGRGRRVLPRVPDRRCAMPRLSPARTTRRRTSTDATSSR